MSPTGCSKKSKQEMIINIRKYGEVKILDKIITSNIMHEKFKSGKIWRMAAVIERKVRCLNTSYV
jgi:hypothetical protein